MEKISSSVKDAVLEASFYEYFKSASGSQQLEILSNLFALSSAEVKYKSVAVLDDIAKLDIVGLIPMEIFLKIFMKFDLKTLLMCRLVCKSWSYKVGACELIWRSQCERYGISLYDFYAMDTCKSVSSTSLKDEYASLDVIGARLFDRHSRLCASLPERTYGNIYAAGRNSLNIFAKQAEFRHVVDQDCKGSISVMVMNDIITAYACEDRHIIVRYARFPHQLITSWEAHQCADLFLHDLVLISGGYDRSICGWNWESGHLLFMLLGSVSAVFSVTALGSLLASSDGCSVITWNLPEQRMLAKSGCFDGACVEELLFINPSDVEELRAKFANPLLLSRSTKELKVWSVCPDGVLRFVSMLSAGQEFSHLQPFLRIFGQNVACSSEYGISVWQLSTMQLVCQLNRPMCVDCMFDKARSFKQRNCPSILLYYTDTIVLQFHLHTLTFQLVGAKSNSKLNVSWKFPNGEKGPWSHRRPGIASHLSAMSGGLRSCSKISVFVGTLSKKILSMDFDFSDVDGIDEYMLADLSLKQD